MSSEDRISGLYAWAIMAGSIIAYDVYAITAKKHETLSSYFWRTLKHPKKATIAIAGWLLLTHHLVLSKEARDSLNTPYTVKETK